MLSTITGLWYCKRIHKWQKKRRLVELSMHSVIPLCRAKTTSACGRAARCAVLSQWYLPGGHKCLDQLTVRSAVRLRGVHTVRELSGRLAAPPARQLYATDGRQCRGGWL